MDDPQSLSQQHSLNDDLKTVYELSKEKSNF
jgi:hypothetical protein